MPGNWLVEEGGRLRQALAADVEWIADNGGAGDNSADVTLAGTPDYLTIAGQVITRGQIDLATDVTGDLPLANLADMATDSFLGRDTAGTGVPEVLSVATTKTLLGLTGTNSGDVTLAGTPDYITISGQVITRGQVDLTTDVTGLLPLANLTDIATDSFLGRDTAGTGVPEVLSVATTKTLLGLTGTNSGDVTVSGTPDYITLSGQDLVRGLIDLTTDVTGDLPFANMATITDARLLGRAAGSGGDIQELTTASPFALSAGALSWSPSASVDFNEQQAVEFVLENRTSDPGAPATGRLWLRTDL